MTNSFSKNNTFTLRAHHLLCTVNYEGKGYNDEFVSNMTGIVNNLKSGSPLIITDTPDTICSSCPNLQANGECALNNAVPEHPDSKTVQVHDLDSYICTVFNISKNSVIKSSEIYKKISDAITPEIFENCCSSCRWYKLGLCSYEKYIDNIKKFF